MAARIKYTLYKEGWGLFIQGFSGGWFSSYQQMEEVNKFHSLTDTLGKLTVMRHHIPHIERLTAKILLF